MIIKNNQGSDTFQKLLKMDSLALTANTKTKV
jgi:hypothetical protein